MTPNILPLLWLHGESFDILEEEIREMHNAGLRGFIAESRPFPGYMEDHWWETLEFILSLAEELGMQVMLFDDSHFPSGYADGIIAKNHPEHLRLLLEPVKEQFSHPGGIFHYDPEQYLVKGDREIAKVFLLKMNPDSSFRADSVRTLPCGKSEIDLPAGEYMLNLWKITRNGGEAHTVNYINFLSPEAVQCYIDTIYKPHVERLKRFVGKSFIGFFSDEPRLGNIDSYDASLGKLEMSLPYSPQLPLDQLPHLILESDDPEQTKTAKFHFMDEVSRLYSKSFPQQIGAFCREHGLLYIGHIIEDNGAHTRLGYGNGHFFRSMEGQSWAGVDTVLGQNRPDHTEGVLESVFGKYNSCFYHWSLMNLGGSAGTLNRCPAFCEIFGAYGWSEGLTQMKWHTDLAVVNGINRLVPHAFSPKEYPDTDCPPHFYARGKNPQWKYFSVWMDYAKRLCKMFSYGRNAANTAVLYHAEAEWKNGTCLPNEIILQHLSQAQIGTLTIPFDALKTASVSDGILYAGDARIKFLLVADFGSLPEMIQLKLSELEKMGVTVFNVSEKNLSSLPDVLRKAGADFFACENQIPHLRCYHYLHEASEEWYLVNEGFCSIETYCILSGRKFYSIEPVSGTIRNFNGTLHLDGNESVILTTKDLSDAVIEIPENKREYHSWKESEFSCKCYPWNDIQNGLSKRPDHAFSGTAVYTLTFCLDFLPPYTEIILPEQTEDAVSCKINGKQMGVCIAPPYRFIITEALCVGENTLQLELTNTLGPLFRSELFDKDFPSPDPGLIGDVKLVL